MFCRNCGKEIPEGGRFCQSCGTETAAPETPKPAKAPGGKQKGVRTWIIIGSIIVVLAAGAIVTKMFFLGTSYWPKEAPDTRTVKSAIWEFDSGDIEKGLTIISVSPSGKYILAADQVTQNLPESFAAGIPNPYGYLPDCLYVYTNQDGEYTQTGSIEVDVDADLELSSTLGVCRDDGVAWNEDETLAIISGWNLKYQNHLSSTHSNIYLVDFSKQEFTKLTDSDDEASHNLFPKWIDNDNIRFIRWEIDSDNMATASLMGMDLKTGSEDLLSDLSVGEGRLSFVLDYEIDGESVYFSTSCADLEYSGFYAAKLDAGKTSPTCLLSIAELREDNIHPYIGVFSSVEVSADGRWVCLSAGYDQRFMARDIPLIDYPEFPQSDPSSAISLTYGTDWVPCHNVFLYDLENDELADPFVDDRLQPDVVIATAATFAPDGKSLICAVFGDGGRWKLDSFNETTLYQIRLDDESFEAVRIFETDVLETPIKLSWLGNNSLLFPTDSPPTYPVQIMIPAAFEEFG